MIFGAGIAESSRSGSMLSAIFESDTKPLLLFLLRESHKPAYTRTGWTIQITAQSSNVIISSHFIGDVTNVVAIITQSDVHKQSRRKHAYATCDKYSCRCMIVSICTCLDLST